MAHESDKASERELELFADNDGDLYRQKFIPIIDNLKRKIKSGKYDPALAPKLWRYYFDEAARKYKKEFGHQFSVATRQALADERAPYEYDKIMRGEYGDVPVRKKNPKPTGGEKFTQHGGIHIDIGTDRGFAKVNPLQRGYSRETVAANIAREVKRGMRQDRAIAASLRSARAAFRSRFPGKKLPAHLRPQRVTVRKRNPIVPFVPRGTKHHRVEKAIDLFQKFRGERPEYLDSKKIQVDDVGLLIGKVDGIAYETTYEGKAERYYHQFADNARPLLVSSHDGKQLYLIGGSYSFTQDGIVDKRR